MPVRSILLLQNFSPASHSAGTLLLSVLANTIPITMPMMRELSDRAFIAGRDADSHAAMLIRVISSVPLIIPLLTMFLSVIFFRFDLVGSVPFLVCLKADGRSVPFLVSIRNNHNTLPDLRNLLSDG